MEPILEKKRLQEVYDTIADSWTNLRAQPKYFVSEINGRLVLDLGCANCRNIIPLLEKDVKCVGLDYSKNMIKEAKKLLKKKKLSGLLVRGDVTKLPFKKSTFDTIIYIATLHHIPTRQLRSVSLEEVQRISLPRCKIYITVWNRIQPKFLWRLFLSIFKKKYEFGDIYQPWNYHGRILYRFYHLYTKSELENDIKRIGFNINEITDVAYREMGNIFAKVSK